MLKSKIVLPSAPVILVIAMTCHERNRAYCESIGDQSQSGWQDAPEWQKNSALNGVKFHLENPTAEASSSHENWMKEKIAHGWVYGQEKSEKQKTHPCLVEFDKLPDEQQHKDHLFKETVHEVCGQAVVTVSVVETIITSQLSEQLPELVKGLIPATAEVQAQRQQLSNQEAVAKRTKAAEKRAKADAKKRDKADAEAAEQQAKRDEAAAKEFAEATPFTGSVEDITGKIVRCILIDDGQSYSADHKIYIRLPELEPTQNGELLLTKAIELPARGREFSVKGLSLVTDAGVLRIVLNGSRKCGGGKAISFPARSLLFRPAIEQPDETA